jgi:CTP:phosphocholine cytidylyltransferase-like protein
MQIIIMAAGKGSRMGALTKNCHKSMLPISLSETFLTRLFHQINEYDVGKVVVTVGHRAAEISAVVARFQFNYEIVDNKFYNEDVNIWSMKLAMDRLSPDEPTIVIEGDIYLDDLALRSIFKAASENSSIWYTRGDFESSQSGGIVKHDCDGSITCMDIVSKYQSKFSAYKKLLGVTAIGPNEHLIYKDHLNSYANKSKKQYWLVPWYQNLDELNCKICDLSKFLIGTVNTASEYKKFLGLLEEQNRCKHPIETSELSQLKPIEGVIQSRALELVDKINKEKIWTKPLIVDREDGLILDGHHRYFAAMKLGLQRVPVIKVEYEEITIWSLRKNISITHKLVRETVESGNLYPNKTVKHSFGFEPRPCQFNLKELS